MAKIKDCGLYEDGGGLRLVVTEKGVKRWALRLTIKGRRVERGLGLFPSVSLDDARRKAEDLRRAAKEGRDAQLEAKRGIRAGAVTFQDAFEDYFEIKRQQLSNGKHVAQWCTTMEAYVFPVIGVRPVAEVTSAEILAVLKPIWFAKPETASRILQRMRAVFDSAILRQTRDRANPCIGVTRELGSDHRRAKHFPALPYADVPAFVRKLRTWSTMPTTRLAFEFLILTAVRSGDVRGALWSEIDLKQRLWSIPGRDDITGRRTKTGEDHVVPLSDRALAIVYEARRLHDGDLVFPGVEGQRLSDSTFSKLLREAGIPATPHGFRSTFKDWTAESGVRDEVSEAALAHADSNRVRAAYRRTRFLEERVALMQRWASFVCQPG